MDISGADTTQRQARAAAVAVEEGEFPAEGKLEVLDFFSENVGAADMYLGLDGQKELRKQWLLKKLGKRRELAILSIL